jgi:CubicO group peptidase (beta-lactamase class C family)
MMSFVVFLFWAALLLASYALSFTPCPLLGPAYPPFTLSQNSTILSTALENLTAQFDQLMATGHDSHGSVTPNTTSFSIALFSTNPGTAASNPFFYEYHYTALSLENSTTGVTSVDADSIYRIGSLTEIFTIWSVLIEAGDHIWNDPVTKYVPELEEPAAKLNSGNEVNAVVDWRSVTVGQLASHMSGISRDCEFFVLFALAQSLTIRNLVGYAGISKDIQDPIAYGFPELPQGTLIACSSYSECNRTGRPNTSQMKAFPTKTVYLEFFASVTKEPPVVLPGTSPAYSSNAFQVLGYVVENITGKPLKILYKAASLIRWS